MKNIALVSLLLGSLANAQGQGTVYFANESAFLSTPPDRLVRFFWAEPFNPYGTNHSPIVNVTGVSYVAQLYFGSSTTSERDLFPVSAPPAAFRSSTTPQPGTWISGFRTLEFFSPGDTVNLQVRIWDLQLASTYEAAAAGGGLGGVLGASRMFSYTIPTNPLGLNSYYMQNFQGFEIGGLGDPVPEPSTFLIRTRNGSCVVCLPSQAPQTLNYFLSAFSALSNFNDSELIQYLNPPLSDGPSSKTWPR
jgi:hypothetical protein